MSRPNMNLKRRQNEGMNWNAEWEKFSRNFQTLRKKTNSQPQKDLLDCTGNFSIPEGDQGYPRKTNTNNSTSSKGTEEVGRNKPNIGDGEVG
jgi:hypothetical protein